MQIGSELVPNAFYNAATGGFDFTYYMQTYYAGQTPEFGVINLGANDNYSQGSVDNLLQMAESIRDYGVAMGKQIKILIMTEYLSPADGYFLSQSSNTDVNAKRNRHTDTRTQSKYSQLVYVRISGKL